MFYLNIGPDGYLRSVSTTPVTGCPAIETLAGLDLSGCRMCAYHWTGSALVLDEDRLRALEEERSGLEKEMQDDQTRAAAMAEVQAALVSRQINALDADDATALRWQLLYPAWAPGAVYGAGERVQRGGRLWRCQQGHTAQAGWEPETAASLWTEVCQAHAGTVGDPIPYGGNMALEAGKYYVQGGVTYRCTRDTKIPVYAPLAELTGLYVEAA